MIDLSDMTLGEIEVIEDEMRLTIGEVGALLGRKYAEGDALPEGAKVGDPLPMPTKLARCMAWLVKHRDNPAFTMADAGKVKATELATIFGVDNEPTRAIEAKPLPDPTGAVAVTA